MQTLEGDWGRSGTFAPEAHIDWAPDPECDFHGAMLDRHVWRGQRCDRCGALKPRRKKR